MKVTNVRGYPLDIGVTGQLVAADETVEVPNDLGARLCEQPGNWREAADEPPADKPRSKTSKATTHKENS